MKVLVEPCWSGGGTYSVRLSAAGYERLTVIIGDEYVWNNSTASRCLDCIEYSWSVDRKNVRFEHY